MIIGFALGGTTSGTTKTMTEKAVLASESELDKIPFGRCEALPHGRIFLAATRLVFDLEFRPKGARRQVLLWSSSIFNLLVLEEESYEKTN